jgi:ectoine hydroxylase-related dioxygenase (phytanoyl-CoA dioxygenase family)
MKEGVPHVQPPAILLEQMLTVRLHLDDANESNGALEVVVGSHRFGKIAPAQIPALREQSGEVVCSARSGDALLMRPLLLHASSRSTAQNKHRRVIHIEYAGFALPEGMAWAEG